MMSYKNHIPTFFDGHIFIIALHMPSPVRFIVSMTSLSLEVCITEQEGKAVRVFAPDTISGFHVFYH